MLTEVSPNGRPIHSLYLVAQTKVKVAEQGSSPSRWDGGKEF